jgi:hypothetical protein
MFEFLRKKQSVPAAVDVLNLDDKSFVKAVSRMITEGQLASGTMCLIANENLRPMMNATFELAANRPNQSIPQDLDGFIRYLAAGLDKYSDEISRRRVQWFFLTSLIWRANAKAAADPTLVDLVAIIWIFLAKSGALLKETVATNVIWEEEEKVWFDHIRTPKDGISYVLVHMLPPFLKDHVSIKAFADEQDISLFNFTGRWI